LTGLKGDGGTAPFSFGNDERTVAGGHDEGLDGEDFTGAARPAPGRRRIGVRPPQHEAGIAKVGKGAWVGIGDRPDEVEDFPGRPSPIHASVFGPTATEGGGLGFVLRRFGRLTGQQEIDLPAVSRGPRSTPS